LSRQGGAGGKGAEGTAVTRTPWPSRKPAARPPGSPDPTVADVARAVAREFACLVAALAVLAGLLLLIEHVGSAAP
jgi:hypothetical protein